MKKPIAVFLTDTHKHKDNLSKVKYIFRQAMSMAETLGVKHIFHGGDVFTNRVGQNLATLITMDSIVKELEERNLTCLAIPGNHDKTDQDAEESYLDLFDCENFVVYHDENVTVLNDFPDICIGWVPYFTDSYEKRLMKLQDIQDNVGCENNILITHKAFNGVKNNDGSEVSEGVAPSSVKWWDKVLVGHYHDASKVGQNIYYTGSAYQGNFGENITDKGFTIIYDDGSLEHKQSDFPQYKKVIIDASDSDAIENELEFYSDSDDYIRFIFQGNKTDLDKITLSRFTDVGIDCKFESTDDLDGVVNVEGENFTQFNSKTIMKHFLKYCKVQSIPQKKRNFGLKILRGDEQTTK